LGLGWEASYIAIEKRRPRELAPHSGTVTVTIAVVVDVVDAAVTVVQSVGVNVLPERRSQPLLVLRMQDAGKMAMPAIGEVCNWMYSLMIWTPESTAIHPERP
jgi:hypothetical protein